MKIWKRLIFPLLATIVILAFVTRSDRQSDGSAKVEKTKAKKINTNGTSHLAGVVKNSKAVAWEKSFETAMARAKATNTPVMVDFHAAWCGPCHMMDKQTYPDAAVVSGSRRFISVKVDVDQRQDVAAAYDVRSLPTVLWIQPNGHPIAGVSGFRPPDEFARLMSDAHKKATS